MVLLTLACLPPAARAADDPKLDIRPRFVTGEKFSLERQWSKKLIVDSVEQSDISSSSVVQVEIVDARPDRLLVRWTFGKPRFANRSYVKDLETLVLSQILPDNALILEFGSAADQVKLKNFDQVKIRAERSRDRMVDTLKSASKATIARVKNAADARFEDDQKLQETFASEPRLFFSIFGRAYTSEPVPIGRRRSAKKDSASGRTFKLKSWDKEKSTAEISLVLDVDNAALSESLRRTTIAAFQKAGRPLPPPEQMPTMNVSAEGTFVIDTARSAVVSFEFHKDVKGQSFAGRREQLEVLRFVRK